MKHHRLITKLPLLLIPLLTACASGPTAQQVANADYGRDISIEECKSIGESFVARQLKDPSSAQFRNSDCSKGHFGSVPIFGMNAEFGWMQTGEVNGKNSYGGYVGFRPYRVLIKNGVPVRYCITGNDRSCMPTRAN